MPNKFTSKYFTLLPGNYEPAVRRGSRTVKCGWRWVQTPAI